jgi:uncharacterized protein YegL
METVDDDLGQMARRSLHVMVLADVSASMSGAPIEALNMAVRVLLPELARVAREHAFANIYFRVIEFGQGARLHDQGAPVQVGDYKWTDLMATGSRTDLGAALDLLTSELDPAKLGPYQYPPAIVLLSDGAPNDDWKSALDRFNKSVYGLKPERTVRGAIVIGDHGDKQALTAFTGNPALVFEAHRSTELIEFLKFVTVQASIASSRSQIGSLSGAAPANALVAPAATLREQLAQAPRDPNDAVF